MGNGLNIQSAIDNANALLSARPIVARDYHMADWKYDKIKEQIEEFQNNLPDTVDVCVQLASFGHNITMVVDSIGYQNPDIMFFYGTVDGNEAQLIQHMSQLNFLLLALPKKEKKDKPRRIGFGENS